MKLIKIDAESSYGIVIGRRGENNAREIAFDISSLVAQYGEGTAVLMVRRPTDDGSYPVVVERDGNDVVWTVTSTDTAIDGSGQCELFWYVDNALAKSFVHDTTVFNDIGGEIIDPPDPYETLVETLTGLVADTQEAARETAQSADDAEAAAAQITGMSAEAETLPAGSEATASYEDGVLTIGVPVGAHGVSPTVTVTEIAGGHRVSITDASGTQTFDVMDGTGGGGGTSNYDDLSNKPKIGGVTLSGNKSASDLGLVAAEPGKGLSSNDFTSSEKNKLSRIPEGAEVNVQSDWNQSDSSADDFIKNKPSIPAAVTVDSALSDASENPVQNKVIKSALDGKGTYSKPSGGIPKTDLDSGVQASLGKADSALQSVPSTYRTAAAQDVIDEGKADKVTEVTISTAGAITQALDAGKIYHFTGAVSSLSLTLNAAASGQIAQYHFDFSSGSTATTVTLAGVTWPDGSFTPEASKHYEVDILNGYGVYLSW